MVIWLYQQKRRKQKKGMTREKALNILHNASVYHPDYLDALNLAIEALEQEPIIDKIRADIQRLRGCSCSCSDGIIDDIEDILDKYKAESEK